MHAIKKLTLAFDWKLGNISFIFPSGNNSFNYSEAKRYNKQMTHNILIMYKHLLCSHHCILASSGADITTLKYFYPYTVGCTIIV